MNFAAAEIQPAKAAGLRERVAGFIELTKPRIAFMLVLTAAAGFYIGSRGSFEPVLFANAMVGIMLLAFGVATLNQYIERSLDALMERTQARPLPSGRVTEREALMFGILQCAVAEVYLFFLVNPLTAGLGIVVFVGYLLVYTPLKTRTSASTALGAIPGAMPPLMGWTAAANAVTIEAWILFAFLFLWQFPHFLAIASLYREDYELAGIRMLPVVDRTGSVTARQIVSFAIMTVAISFAPFFFGFAGSVFAMGAAVLGIWFLAESVLSARARTRERYRRLLLVSVIYLPLIFGLLALNKL
jgi:heme o synthase